MTWWPFRKREFEGGSVRLIDGRIWSPNGITRGDVALVNGRQTEEASDLPSGALQIDLAGLLVTPGLVDACHPLAEDCLPPLAPGPYTDRQRREEDLVQLQPSAIDWAAKLPPERRLAAGVLDCLRNGVTCVASPDAPDGEPPALRTADTVWVRSLVWEKDPARVFARANSKPVLVSAADGTSRAAGREMDRLAEMNMLAANLALVGGAALTPSDAAKLAEVGATLVWRPVVDEYVLGLTVSPDVFTTPGLQILIGGGSRRDGGRGLLAALQAADRLGFLPRERLLDAATSLGGRLLCGNVSRETSGDLCVWDADDLEDAVFARGALALQMVLVDGRVVLCREAMYAKMGQPEHLHLVEGADDLYCMIDRAECFT